MELNVHQDCDPQKATASMHHSCLDGSWPVYVLISKDMHVSYFIGSPERYVRFVCKVVLFPSNLTITNYLHIG